MYGFHHATHWLGSNLVGAECPTRTDAQNLAIVYDLFIGPPPVRSPRDRSDCTVVGDRPTRALFISQCFTGNLKVFSVEFEWRTSRNLLIAQFGAMEVIMEVSTRPLLFTSKKTPSPWNFQGHLSAADLGLASSSLPREWRILARAFTKMSVDGWLTPSCASSPASALRCSSSAWRLEVAPLVRHYKLATQVSGNLCNQCSMQTTMYYPYQYQSHGFCGLPTSTRKVVGTVWGPLLWPSFARIHPKDLWQFCHIMFILPITTMKCGWRSQQRITLMSHGCDLRLSSKFEDKTQGQRVDISTQFGCEPSSFQSSICTMQITSNLRMHPSCANMLFLLKRSDKLATWHPFLAKYCKHLLLNFNISMLWNFHTWRDLRWFEMICVKLTCSCTVARLYRWQSQRWSENVVVVSLHFSKFFPTQNATRPWLLAACISGASLNFPRRGSTVAKLPAAASVSWCSGPSRRSQPSRTRRSSGSASSKAPRASSTRASLSRGSPQEPKSLHGFRREREQFLTLRFHGIFLDPNPWWGNKILQSPGRIVRKSNQLLSS